MNELKYQVVRSPRRKTLTITVERDRRIIVHAPTETSEQEVHRVIDAKRQWIFEKLRHPQKYAGRPSAPGKEVVNGESAPYLGRDYRIQIAETLSGDIELSGGFLVPLAHQARRREVLKNWYITEAKDKILARTRQQARELGVEFKAAKIVDNRFRWGSCTAGGNVNFNWRLIKAPMFVIDYVIVHELAHLIVSNHTAEFWTIVRAKSPTAEKARAWLKEHGQMLEKDV
jgi:predicted metal-dependent hydrolase